MSGSRSYQTGLAAEAIVRRAYEATGLSCVATRLRTPAGEIDLVFRGPDGLVFVEVKAARTLDAALESLGARQIARIVSAAEHYGDEGEARRIDLAAVDRTGRIEIVENITL